MGTQFLTKLPKLNLSPKGRESVRIARLYACTGKYETLLPSHIITGQPPAGPLWPESSGDSEPQSEPWQPTPGIIDQDRMPEPGVQVNQSCDFCDLERYFATATIPPGSIRINVWIVINNPMKAIAFHLVGLKASPPTSLAAKADLNHLKEIKACLEAGKKPLAEL